jgi:hypothetical protein
LVAIILIGSNDGKDKKQAGAELCQAHLRSSSICLKS